VVRIPRGSRVWLGAIVSIAIIGPINYNLNKINALCKYKTKFLGIVNIFLK